MLSAFHPVRRQSVFRGRVPRRSVLAGVVVVCVVSAATALTAAQGRAAGASLPSTAACTTLKATVPTAGPAGPLQGMGKSSWNVVLTNTGMQPCTLQGWPHIDISGPAGGVPGQIHAVDATDLVTVTSGKVTLQRNENAVVSVTTTADAPVCVAGATLTVTLSGSEAVSVQLPTTVPGVCAGGDMSVSPAYGWGTLTTAANAIASPSGSPAYAAASAAPSPCAIASLTADVVSQQAAQGGAVIVVRVRNNAAQECAVLGGVAAIRANEPGKSPVGKEYSNGEIAAASGPALRTYTNGQAQSTFAVVSAGSTVDVTVLALNATGAACADASSISIYPSPVAIGNSLKVSLPEAVTVCGNPLVLPIISESSSASQSLTVGASALASAVADRGARMGSSQAVIAANASGFTYGTDSNGPTAIGSGPYNEPNMPAGQSAPYGFYVGQRGTYFNFKCGSTGLQWNSTDYNAAQWNWTHGVSASVGAAAVYMTGGPGRDPSYNGTTAEASAWGKAQADNAISGSSMIGTGFPYIFMDIENVVNSGWNAVWNGCGTTKKASSVPVSMDNATFSGFANEVWNNSIFYPGVYDAGGGGSNSWSSVFGSTSNGTVAEWTYVNETSSLSSFPNGWAVGSTTPVFFGGVTTGSGCSLLWQWSGGNGQLNGKGDFDQLDIAHMRLCHP